MWSYRQQPTRLPCPWDSQGKNTGVGCHFLLQCIKVKSEPCPLSTRAATSISSSSSFGFSGKPCCPVVRELMPALARAGSMFWPIAALRSGNGLYLLTLALAVTTIPYFPFFLSRCCSWSCLPPSGHLQAPGVTVAQEPKPLGRFDSWVETIPWRRAWQPTRFLAWKIPWAEKPEGLQTMGDTKSWTPLKQLSTAQA